MSKKLDHEKINQSRRILSQGASWTNAAALTEKERNALAEGRERHRARAKKQQDAHEKSLVQNLQPTDSQQAVRQLKTIREIYQSLSAEERAKEGKWMQKKISELEARLSGAQSKSVKFKKRRP